MEIPSRLASLALGLLLAAEARPASAQVAGDAPLHEFVPIVRHGARAGDATASDDAPSTSDPHKPLSTSSPSAAPRPGEQVYAAQPDEPVVARDAPPHAPGADPPPLRDARVEPDRATGDPPPGRHAYHEVFDPAIAPFKRMTALDAVDADGALRLADPTVRPLSPAPKTLGRDEAPPSPARGWDRFRGEVVLDAPTGRWVPLPSVVGGSRLVALAVSPPARVELGRDAADNAYARLSAAGPHRLAWIEDAPRRAFGGPVPARRLADVPRALAPSLPPALRADAERVLARIFAGALPPPPLRGRLAIAPTVDTLVDWFRGFTAGTLPTATAATSTYAAIALGRKGICRHRAYAFTVTAHALGLPARYVENEVHAWVEVYLPAGPLDGGWRRIDLGGGALDVDALGAAGRRPYEPGVADPFSRPRAYREAGAAARGLPGSDGRGGGRGPGDGAGDRGDGASGRGDGMQGGAPARPAADFPSSTAVAGDDPAPPSPSAATPGSPDPARPGDRSGAPPPSGAPTPAVESGPRLAPTRVALDDPAREIYRGDALTVRGRVIVIGAGASGLRVTLALASAEGVTLPLGDVVTDGTGAFATTIEVPRTLPLGRYRLRAITSGDATRAPSE